MLFSSIPFIALFLPITAIAFFLARSEIRAQYILIIASLFFYGWWDYRFLPFIIGSVGVNYWLSMVIGNAADASRRKHFLALGIVLNLVPLAFFKYANFFISNANSLGAGLPFLALVLPLGISFFTFQKIALLADIYHREIHNPTFRSYLLFIIFFPHMIAGPITNPREMLPQFEKASTYRFRLRNFFVGLSFFIIGLAKKVCIADQVARYSTPIFMSVHAGQNPSWGTAWGATIAFALQIYFDFSGYSDMAIGLARIFSINMPLNFYSPYKAKSMIEFWRRWHMSLSRFLRDYLYIPLGGNRLGYARTLANIMIVMLLGGFWHGASWNFVLWGAMHGVVILANHVWRDIPALSRLSRTWWTWPATVFAAVVAWVPFRAPELHSVGAFYSAMFGLLPLKATLMGPYTHEGIKEVVLLFGVAVFAAVAPNTVQLFSRYKPFEFAPASILSLFMRPTIVNGIVIAALFALSLVIVLEGPHEFLYFQF